VIKSGITKQPTEDDNGHLEHFSLNFELAAKFKVRFNSLVRITIDVAFCYSYGGGI
jgi:hypothetical protein